MGVPAVTGMSRGVAGPRRWTAGVLAVGLLAVSAGCSSDDKVLLELTPQAVATCLLFDDTPGAEISDLPVVDCDGPHSHEIFAVLDYVQVSNASNANREGEPTTTLTDVYPGFAALESFAQAKCLGAFERYVGVSAFDSELFYSWIVPTLTSWESDKKDREVLCLAGSPDPEGLPPGSIEDTGTTESS